MKPYEIVVYRPRAVGTVCKHRHSKVWYNSLALGHRCALINQSNVHCQKCTINFRAKQFGSFYIFLSNIQLVSRFVISKCSIGGDKSKGTWIISFRNCMEWKRRWQRQAKTRQEKVFSSFPSSLERTTIGLPFFEKCYNKSWRESSAHIHAACKFGTKCTNECTSRMKKKEEEEGGEGERRKKLCNGFFQITQYLIRHRIGNKRAVVCIDVSLCVDRAASIRVYVCVHVCVCARVSSYVHHYVHRTVVP